MKIIFELDTDKINSLQLESLRKQIKRTKHAHFTNLQVRINGEFEYHEADWIKHLAEIEAGK
jgi:hypothetical protein